MAESSSDGFSFTKKLGPLPTYTWIALGVGGYVVFAYIKKRNTPTSSGNAQFAIDNASANSFGAPPQAGQPGVSGITTNGQWATEAATALTNSAGQYGWQPAEIETALSGYLQGLPLAGAGPQIVNTAIAEFGSPPEGVIGTAAQSVPNTTIGSGQTTPTFQSNEQWASYAQTITQEEIAFNPKPYSNVDVGNAISAYINNQPLSSIQTTIVNHVLQLAGAPPYPVTAPGSLVGNVYA